MRSLPVEKWMRLGCASAPAAKAAASSMNPFDLPLAAKRVGQPIRAVPNNAINPFDASRGKDFRELIYGRPGHCLSFQ
jgi:hypothetical protein